MCPRGKGEGGHWGRRDAGRGGRVVAAGMKRVALTQAKHRKQAAPPRPVDLEAACRVPRARRLEPAMAAQERGQQDLVAPDQDQQSARGKAWTGHRSFGADRPKHAAGRADSPALLRPGAARVCSPRPTPPHLRQSEVLRPLASDHDQIDAARQQTGPGTETLAADALDAVPRDRVPHLARHDEAEARRAGLAELGPLPPRGARNEES